MKTTEILVAFIKGETVEAWTTTEQRKIEKVIADNGLSHDDNGMPLIIRKKDELSSEIEGRNIYTYKRK